MRPSWLLLLVLLTGCASSPDPEPVVSGIDEATRERLSDWQSVIRDNRDQPDHRQLEAANDFVNQFDFVDDIIHWGEEDYWATPLQTVVTAGGDCEDFAIAKYFTLDEMGMDTDKLRLTYVKALTLDQAHMVVSYYPRATAEPLVLDNLDPVIRPASERDDLLPVYSFNGDGLWLAKQRESEYVDTSQRLSLWQQLLQSMSAEAADEEMMICRYQYYQSTAAEARAQCP